jgi:hypothetical protein
VRNLVALVIDHAMALDIKNARWPVMRPANPCKAAAILYPLPKTAKTAHASVPLEADEHSINIQDVYVWLRGYPFDVAQPVVDQRVEQGSAPRQPIGRDTVFGE